MEDVLGDIYGMWLATDPGKVAGYRLPVLLVLPAPRSAEKQLPVELKDVTQWAVIGGYLVVGKPDEPFSEVLVRLNNIWRARLAREMTTWQSVLPPEMRDRLPDVPQLESSWIDESHRLRFDNAALEVGHLAAAGGHTLVSDQSMFLKQESTRVLAGLSHAQEFVCSYTLRLQTGAETQPDQRWRIGHGGNEDHASATMIDALEKYRDAQRKRARGYVDKLIALVRE